MSNTMTSMTTNKSKAGIVWLTGMCFLALQATVFAESPKTQALGVSDSIHTTGVTKSIHVEITTPIGDAQSFEEGDVIQFYVSLDKDAYLCLIYQNANGHIVQLVPNKLSQITFFPAGDYFKLPDGASGYQFKVSVPYGKEAVWIFAASKPFPTLVGQRLEDGGLSLVGQSLRDIHNKFRNHGNKEGVHYGEAHTTFVTVEKSRPGR